MFNWLKNAFSKPSATSHEPIDESATLTSEQWRQQGNLLLDRNDFKAAAECYQQALKQSENDLPSLINLGFTLSQLQQFNAAKEVLEKALKIDPHNADACFSLGQIEQQHHRFDQAIKLYIKALQTKPDFDFCRQNLCALLFQLGRIAEALKSFDERPFLEINSFAYHQFKAEAFLRLEQIEQAQQHFEKALNLAPQNHGILLQLACINMRKRRLDLAQQDLEKILKENPNHGEALGFLAACCQLKGHINEACRRYREAIQLDPSNFALHQNYLYALSYAADCSPQDYLVEARAFAAKLKSTQDNSIFASSKRDHDEHRPLRIGFVSGDLRAHPVGLFLENVLASLDKTQFYCIAYANQAIEDEISLRLKSHFQQWHLISALDDQTLANQIAANNIDILFDLAGHTERNRLGVFTLKPASLQIAWLGYWASTGLSEIDYILVDKKSVPEMEHDHFSEKPLYLEKTRLCMSVPKTTRAIEVSDTPALRKGSICFASFQVPNKMTDSTLQLWANTLRALPEASMRLQHAAFEFDQAQQDIIERFSIHGIPAHRLQFVAGMSYSDYLAAHAEVDIILDTHPFPGGTTTAEAIWMGVPTISLIGSSLLSRQGESMLSCVGLDAWIANDEEHFVQIATKYATDIQTLNQIRRNLRQAALASPLFDASQFTRNFEQVVNDAWRQHLSK